jgi:hypothetical protein
MFTAGKRALCAVVAVGLLLAPARARADYASVSVPLDSQFAGPNVGMVVAEANNGPATVNGLLSGQVRLTFTVNPVPAYTQTGPRVGFTNVQFNTDLTITPSQISLPLGWTASGQYGLIVSPTNIGLWQVFTQKLDARSASVVLLFSGLGNQATLDHFVTPVQVFLPNPEFGEPPPFIFGADVGYPGPGMAPVWTDPVVGHSVRTTPEPSTLAMAAIGLAGMTLARRWRMRSRH